ncbi:MAG TPA: response regulator [Streptosporangiaceae bacterium]
MSESAVDLPALFRDETTQRLDQMDTALLAVEAGEAGAETVDSLFRNAHTIKGAAGMLGFDDVRAVAHAAEDILSGVREAQVFPPALAGPLLVATAALRAQVTGDGPAVDDVLGELAASRAALLDGDVRPPGAVAAEPSPPEAAEPVQAVPPATGSPPADVPPPAGTRRELRVPAEKIDHLLDVVGEIMQHRRRLTHSLGPERELAPGVAEVLGAGQRMLDDLKGTAVDMRTLPLAAMTGPLPRAVRDFARAAGKDVEFVITGADTELDRVILESLPEPLTHLLRNAVVHGIECPAGRERAGKPGRGRVELRAVPRGPLVEIVVADDGQGVTAEVIEAARREGSLADLLGQPGYSTAPEVSDLAGRGVGLDAVAAYVRSLGGSLDVSSEPGHGMAVTLLLPLALALVEVLLFERGGAVYGVPLPAVEEVVTVTRTLVLQGRPALELRGRSVPVADFAALIGTAAPPLGDRSPALVITVGGRRAAVTCDALLGQEEVVVKPLGPLFGGVDGYLGATILGDGRVALLVEPGILTRGSRQVAATARPMPMPPAPDRAVAARKVLVVEDSFSVRELQRSILETAGYLVVTARDGRDAIETLGQDTGIALVITDLEMPELDGLQLTRTIRADAAWSSLPVIIVTSQGSEEDRRRGIEAGADAYMAKRSFDQQALLLNVERLIGR